MRREEHRPSHLSQGAFALLLKACFFHMWTALLRTHLPPLFTNRLIASPHTLNPDAGNPYHSGHLLTRRTHPSGACSLSRTGPVIPPLGLNDNTDNTFVYLWGCAGGWGWLCPVSSECITHYVTWCVTGTQETRKRLGKGTSVMGHGT